MLKYIKKSPPPRRGRVRMGVKTGFFHTFEKVRGFGAMLFSKL
jgi:hypothetical protein